MEWMNDYVNNGTSLRQAKVWFAPIQPQSSMASIENAGVGNESPQWNSQNSWRTNAILYWKNNTIAVIQLCIPYKKSYIYI